LAAQLARALCPTNTHVVDYTSVLLHIRTATPARTLEYEHVPACRLHERARCDSTHQRNVQGLYPSHHRMINRALKSSAGSGPKWQCPPCDRSRSYLDRPENLSESESIAIRASERWNTKHDHSARFMCAPFITGKRLKEAYMSAFRQHEGSLVSLSEGVSPAAGVQVVYNGNKALSTAYTGSIDHRGSSHIGTCDSWARRQSHALERDFKHVLVSWVSILTSLSPPQVHEHRTYWKVSHVLLLKK
jgi:hypothetical protein